MDSGQDEFGPVLDADDDELMSLLKKTDREGESSKRVSTYCFSYRVSVVTNLSTEVIREAG
jgi:hypothetical protein